MLIQIPDIFTKSQAKKIRDKIESELWVDGNVTAGLQSAQAKHNKQLPEDSTLAQELGELILSKLGANSLFLSAALPQFIFPPLFNRYDVGDSFGIHVDNAIRPLKNSLHRIRTDLSMTLFLTEPEDYEGGELEIETQFGAQTVKLEAGSAILYPSTSLHKVNKITKGSRISSFFWMQSMVRDEGERAILFDFDQSIQRLAQNLGHKNEEVIRLTGIYHNMVRRWAEV